MTLRPTLLTVVLLGLPAPARADDVPAVLQAKTVRLLDAITRGDPAVWDQELDERARVVDEMVWSWTGGRCWPASVHCPPA